MNRNPFLATALLRELCHRARADLSACDCSGGFVNASIQTNTSHEPTTLPDTGHKYSAAERLNIRARCSKGVVSSASHFRVQNSFLTGRFLGVDSSIRLVKIILRRVQDSVDSIIVRRLSIVGFYEFDRSKSFFLFLFSRRRPHRTAEVRVFCGFYHIP